MPTAQIVLYATEEPVNDTRYRVLVNCSEFGRFGRYPSIPLNPTLTHVIKFRRLSTQEVAKLSDWTEEWMAGAIYQVVIDGHGGMLMSLRLRGRHRFKLVEEKD